MIGSPRWRKPLPANDVTTAEERMLLERVFVRALRLLEGDPASAAKLQETTVVDGTPGPKDLP